MNIYWNTSYQKLNRGNRISTYHVQTLFHQLTVNNSNTKLMEGCKKPQKCNQVSYPNQYLIYTHRAFKKL